MGLLGRDARNTLESDARNVSFEKNVNFIYIYMQGVSFGYG